MKMLIDDDDVTCRHLFKDGDSLYDVRISYEATYLTLETAVVGNCHFGNEYFWNGHCGKRPFGNSHFGTAIVGNGHCGQRPLWETTIVGMSIFGTSIVGNGHCGKRPFWETAIWEWPFWERSLWHVTI